MSVIVDEVATQCLLPDGPSSTLFDELPQFDDDLAPGEELADSLRAQPSASEQTDDAPGPSGNSLPATPAERPTTFSPAALPLPASSSPGRPTLVLVSLWNVGRICGCLRKVRHWVGACWQPGRAWIPDIARHTQNRRASGASPRFDCQRIILGDGDVAPVPGARDSDDSANFDPRTVPTTARRLACATPRRACALVQRARIAH